MIRRWCLPINWNRPDGDGPGSQTICDGDSLRDPDRPAMHDRYVDPADVSLKTWIDDQGRILCFRIENR